MIKNAVKLGTFIFVTKATYDILYASATVLLKRAGNKLDEVVETLKEGTEENEDES